MRVKYRHDKFRFRIIRKRQIQNESKVLKKLPTSDTMTVNVLFSE